MSSSSVSEFAGSVFGFTIASLMFWIGVGFLPFTTQVATWFRARMQADPVVRSLGGKDASENMSPGHVVLFSVGSIVVSAIILWNAGRSISGLLPHAGIDALPLLLMIFTGFAGLVGGTVSTLHGVADRARARGWLVPAGLVIAIAGLVSLGSGIAMVLGARQ